MSFDTLCDFFPAMKFNDRAAIYAVMGTIPAYLEKMNAKAGLSRNVHELILSPGSYLYNEVEFLLREELREPRSYFAILRAIAQGKRKLSEIINDTGFEKSHLSRYLDIIRSLGIVDKEVPVTERQPEKNRKGLYRIHDRFFTFWFRYVFPNRSKLEIGNQAYVVKKMEASLEIYISTAYEEICKELCLRFTDRGRMQFDSIGRWWSRNEEIDIVALDEEQKQITFGECKWSKKKVGLDVYRNLVRKSKLVELGQG